MFCLIVVEIAFIASISLLIYGGTQARDGLGHYIAAIVAAVFWMIFNCILFCNWAHLYTAIAIIDAAADFFVDTKRIALVVFTYFIIQILAFSFWLAG